MAHACCSHPSSLFSTDGLMSEQSKGLIFEDLDVKSAPRPPIQSQAPTDSTKDCSPLPFNPENDCDPIHVNYTPAEVPYSENHVSETCQTESLGTIELTALQDHHCSNSDGVPNEPHSDVANEPPFAVVQDTPNVEEDSPQEIRPRIIKLVNNRTDNFMCNTCSYKTRYIRSLRHHEITCLDTPKPPSSAVQNKGIQIPTSFTHQLIVSPHLVNRLYPGATQLRLITSQNPIHVQIPQTSSTADAIARGVTGQNMVRSIVIRDQGNSMISSSPAIVTSGGVMTTAYPQIVSHGVSPQSSMAVIPVTNPPLSAQTTQPQVIIATGQFSCKLCPYKGQSQQALANHSALHHTPIYKCNYCEFRTQDQSDMGRHLEFRCEKRPRKCFSCVVCNFVMYKEQEIAPHFQLNHPLVPLTTPGNLVRMYFDNRVPNFQTGEQQNVPNLGEAINPPHAFYTCSVCSMRAGTIAELTSHIETCHGSRSQTSPSTGSNHVQTNHVDPKTKVDDGPNPLIVVAQNPNPQINVAPNPQIQVAPNPTICVTPNPNPQIQDAPNPNPQICVAPNPNPNPQIQVVPNPVSLPFSCSVDGCTYGSKSVYNLNRHVKMKHTNPKPTSIVNCQYCEQVISSTHLHRHIQSKHPEMMEGTPAKPRDKCCTQCAFQTTTAAGLRRHISSCHADRSEPSTEPVLFNPEDCVLSCEICDFQTKRREQLVRHKKTQHPGVFGVKKAENIKCEHCDFRTHSQAGYVNHFRCKHPDKMSPDDSPLCEHCNQRTSSKAAMATHMKKYHEDVLDRSCGPSSRPKQHACSLCPYKTAYKLNVARHMRTVHKEQFLKNLEAVAIDPNTSPTESTETSSVHQPEASSSDVNMDLGHHVNHGLNNSLESHGSSTDSVCTSQDLNMSVPVNNCYPQTTDNHTLNHCDHNFATELSSGMSVPDDSQAEIMPMAVFSIDQAPVKRDKL